MFSPFLGIFGTWLAIAGICQAGNLDRSSLAPLSIVYTVYPYYNSESLLGIWKAEEPLQVSANVAALGRISDGQEKAVNAADATSRDENSSDSNARDSYRNNSKESTHSTDEQATEITYWPPVQRGAAPKRLTRATRIQSSNLKKSVYLRD